METLTLDLDHPLRSFHLAVTLEVGAETVALVGPSGAGKSTVLRSVAGLVRPERGFVACGGTTWLDRERGIDVPPDKRRVGLLFQEYALFPHLDVRRTVAFGARDPSAVAPLLERLRIGHLGQARPTELSGGERQRVALARALAREPEVLLLDEPLSNLDAKLRVQMRTELKMLQRKLGITAIYVTHDQEEANAVADRIAVLDQGRIQQIGAPTELYDHPANPSGRRRPSTPAPSRSATTAGGSGGSRGSA